jgi:hypothetical protein
VGLFSGLMMLPLAPARGVAWIGEQLLDEAEREALDPERIGRQLDGLAEAESAGEITERERAEAEEVLVAQLLRARGRDGDLPGGWA